MENRFFDKKNGLWYFRIVLNSSLSGIPANAILYTILQAGHSNIIPAFLSVFVTSTPIASGVIVE